jgi:trimeric autotransporter adhesin
MLNGTAATTAPPTCKFSPSSISNASGASTLTIGTTGPSASLAPVSMRSRLFYAMLLPISGLTLMGAGFGSRKNKLLGIVLACLMITGLLFQAACGGGGSNGGGGGGGGGTVGTPAGTYTISVSGSAGSATDSTKVTLTVQ